LYTASPALTSMLGIAGSSILILESLKNLNVHLQIQSRGNLLHKFIMFKVNINKYATDLALSALNQISKLSVTK
jgi:hypothetical protein